MECCHCKGKLVRGSTPFSADRNGYHVTWESVPAWVCAQCGEALIEEHEVNHIQFMKSSALQARSLVSMNPVKEN